MWIFPDNKALCPFFISALRNKPPTRELRNLLVGSCQSEDCICQHFDGAGRLNLESYDCIDSSLKILNKECSRARQSLDVAVYSLTFMPLVEVMIHMKRRYNINVRIILDPSDLKLDRVDKLATAGIDVRIKNQTIPGSFPSKMHNKCVLVDQKVLFTGSFNWSDAVVTKNNENLMRTESRQLVQLWLDEY